MALQSGHNAIFSMNCCFAVFHSLIRLVQNIKISAVRSLADICFLHVLYFLLCYSIRCFSYAIRVNCVHIKLLSVSCSSFGSTNTTRYSTVLLLLFCGFH